MVTNLVERYSSRLGLPGLKELPISLESLQKITEAHLEKIPFGNLGQHGCGSTVFDLEETSTKLLDEGREGFCYEVNLLLAELLAELGYQPKLLDAQVSKKTFWTPNVHLWILVDIEGKQYYVDVGFGEPPIHPLPYEMGTETETPDGLVHRFVEQDDEVILEWKQGDVFVPRLKWKAELIFKEASGFEENFNMVMTDKLPFAHKYFIVKLTKDSKISISGKKLKITEPRSASPKITEFESIGEVREKLTEIFGLPKSATEGLDWTKSLEAPAELWMQF